MLTNGANTKKCKDLASFNIVNTTASTESVSMDLVNIVEDYNTAENLAISSSERMAIKTDFADMVAYKDYDLAFLAKSI